MKLRFLFILSLTCSATTALAQTRDSRAERLVLDNNLGSTIVLRTPVGAITGGTLTIPDPAGASGAFLISTPSGGTQSMSAHLVPGTNNTFNLGSASLRWKDLFVGPNSLHVGTAAGDEVILNYNSTTAKRLLIDANGDGTSEAAITENGRIGIGTLLPVSALDVSGGVTVGATYAGTNAAPTNGLLVQGNVGMGVTTTTKKLEVAGAAADLNVRMGSVSGAATTTTYTPGANDGIIVADNNGDLQKRTVGSVVSATGWALTGNAGTDDTTNYIGTTDDNDLAFASEGTIRARFLRTTGVLDLGVLTDGAFIPESDNTNTLGIPSRRWKDIFLGPGSIHIGKFTARINKDGPSTQSSVDEATISYDEATGQLIIDKPLATAGSMQPDVDGFGSLGSTNKRWADIFIGQNSLHIGLNSGNEGTISFPSATTDFRFNSNTGVAPEMILSSTAALTLGNDVPTQGSLVFNDNAATSFTGTLQTPATLTANLTYTLPSASGTLATTGDFGTITLSGDVTGTAGANTINTGSATTGNNVITAIGQSSNTIGDANIANALTISGGTITNSPITNSPISGSTGSFTTIAGTSLLILGSDATPTAGTVVLHDGAITNTFKGTVQTTGTLTADRTYTLPDATGTLALTSDVSGFTLGGDVTGTPGANTINTASATTGNNIITAIGAATTGTISDTRVADNLTITGGTISNSPISGSTGSFTTIAGSSFITLGSDATPTAGTVVLHDGVITNTFKGTVQTAGTLTADRTYTLPNVTGTIALTSDISGFTLGGDVTGTPGANTINTASATTGNNVITAIGQSSNTISDANIANALTISGGTITSSPITSSAISGSTGSFTTLAASSTSDLQGVVSNSTGDVTIGDNLVLANNAGAASEIRFAEPSGTDYSAFKAGAQASNVTYTLPVSEPSVNQVLLASAVTGAGPYDVTLAWGAPSPGGSAGGDLAGTYPNPTISQVTLSGTTYFTFVKNATTARIHVQNNNQNVALGFALPSNTTGGSNVAVGNFAMELNQTGADNTAVGTVALVANVSGGSNTALGAGTLQTATTSNNTAVGRQALNTTSTGGNNTAVGFQAGIVNTTGTDNTYVGYLANGTSGSTSLTNATAIGANAQVGQSNALVLGSGADVGIGTSTPGAKLEVRNGNVLLSNSGTAGELRMQGTGTGYSAFKAGAQGATTITYTLPTAAPTNDGQVLSTTTGGTLSWGPQFIRASATLDFPNTTAQTSSDLTITVTGAAISDEVVLGVDNASVLANSAYTAWVSAAGTVTVRFNNYQITTAQDPASGTFKVTVIR